MTAKTALGLFKNAVRQTGRVKATGMVEKGGAIEIEGMKTFKLPEPWILKVILPQAR